MNSSRIKKHDGNSKAYSNHFLKSMVKKNILNRQVKNRHYGRRDKIRKEQNSYKISVRQEYFGNIFKSLENTSIILEVHVSKNIFPKERQNKELFRYTKAKNICHQQTHTAINVSGSSTGRNKILLSTMEQSIGNSNTMSTIKILTA